MGRICLCSSSDEAVEPIFDGATIMVGGFAMCGMPENLIRALARKGVKNLTIIGVNPGAGEKGLAILVKNGQVRKNIATFVVSGERGKFYRDKVMSGEVIYECIPQGTLVERARARAAGLGGFYTPVGVGTPIAEGKETRVIDGKEYILELPLKADFALIKGYIGDKKGNIYYRLAARNFNPVFAAAADCTIAEVEKMVEPGEIQPEHVHTPFIFVDRIVQGEYYEKAIR